MAQTVKNNLPQLNSDYKHRNLNSSILLAALIQDILDL